MDATQDIILGVLGTQWERTRVGGVNTYLESIKRSGYTGRKVMLVWDIHPTTRTDLLRYGFELVDLPSPPEPFFIARIRVVYEYLRDHHKEFRWIHWFDVKDFVLQSDPSVWIDQNAGNYSIIASSEPVPICTEETNWLWARSILGEPKAHEIANCLVINGGTFSGKAEAMLELFHQTHLLCKDYTGGFPPCQISLNYIMHTMLKEDLNIPLWSEGYAVCGHPIWSPWRVQCWPHMRDPHPVLDIEQCIIHAGTTPSASNRMVRFNDNWGTDTLVKLEHPSHPLWGIECPDKPEGKVFSIFHGYDRSWTLKRMFEFKYREHADFNLENFNKWNEALVAAQPAVHRGLRSVKRERITGNSFVPQPGRVFQRH
jgi:hypothetical protein